MPPVYPVDQKALEDYVNLPDSHYSYTLVTEEEHSAATVYTINMTSLKWLDDSEVDKTIWWHMVTIAVPKVFINDPTTSLDWLMQFPMVKATVRAIDTVTDFLLKQTGEDVQITEFMLVGSSKRGWIAWLTAAIDKRVVSFVSVVMDFLNFVENFHHQYRSYCGWSFALAPFYLFNVTRQIDDPRFELMASNVDPLKYNEQYANKTKYLLVASGDEICQPDNSNYYFNQLKGKKYLRIDFRMHVLSGQEAKRNPIKWNRVKVNKVATYSSFADSDETFMITSELHIIPETFPCEDCAGEACYGKLV
ncbi:autocrine proliferation repressor protein A-like [Python bivittatus]|uniref:Autocrine proliferation repressor protein A-like n=1 Tax=Python bivittatus TaxID=176946 RepID=A0A9F5IZ86_PYTBI|nr:autocrine proliferation repressor protein A-like [Python bivittatus]